MDNARKMRQGKFQALSPMVRGVLKKTGNSLWGRNLPWSRKYYIYERSERWLLCDGREEKLNNISEARTRIEINLRSTYFKVKLTRFNNVRTNIRVSTHDLSKRELFEGLQEIIREMTNPTGRDDGADDETVASDVPAVPAPTDLGEAAPEETVQEARQPEPEPVAENIPQPAVDASELEASPEPSPQAETEQTVQEEVPLKRKRAPRKKVPKQSEVVSASQEESSEDSLPSIEDVAKSPKRTRSTKKNLFQVT